METEAKKSLSTPVILGIIAGAVVVLLVILTMVSLPYILGATPRTPAANSPSALKMPTLPPTEPPTEPPLLDIPLNPFGKLDFQYDGAYLSCLQTETVPGIDVSAFQGEVDWEKVAASGIEFAMIRVGFRGYGKAGTLVEDEYARANLEGAIAAGLDSAIMDPCSQDMMGTIFACEALRMKDKGGRKYNRAYRQGKFGQKK